jgi:hypothetical protein
MTAEEVTYEAKKYQSFPKWDKKQRGEKMTKKEPIINHAGPLF